ncbi:unknown [Prevotella sp. CAG:487]|nr:unknown [Prevotella sp. CAG:487]
MYKLIAIFTNIRKYSIIEFFISLLLFEYSELLLCINIILSKNIMYDVNVYVTFTSHYNYIFSCYNHILIFSFIYQCNNTQSRSA